MARGEVEHDEGAGARAVLGRVGLHLRRVQHGEVGHERGQVAELGSDEHVPHEERVPCVRRDVAHGEAVARIGAGPEVLHEQLWLGGEVGAHVGEQLLVVLGREGAIHIAPPHVVLGSRFFDEELVLGGAAGVGRGDADERSAVGERAFIAADGRLDELGCDEIPMNGPLGRESECFEAGLALALARLGAGGGLRCHVVSSLVQKESLAPLHALHGAGRSAAWMHMQVAPDETGAQAAYAGVRGASIARRYTCRRSPSDVTRCAYSAGIRKTLMSRRARRAADDDQRKRPLRIRADAVRERGREKAQRGDERRHHDRPEPEHAPLPRGLQNVHAAIAELVGVRDVDDGRLHRDAEQREEADAG